MTPDRILLVDDNASVRTTLQKVLELHGFEVVSASNVNEALSRIGKEAFDVLLSDLHMPGRGDGLTVVSAMRHSNPNAVTLLFSGYPEMQEAMSAILLQADDILVKPLEVPALIELIRDKLRNRTPHGQPTTESAATVVLSCDEETVV